MYRRHVAAVHPPEEASLCLRWGCIQEQPTATSIPLIPFSFSPFFPPLPLLLFSFLFVRWYWISFFRKFDFAKGLIQTNEVYMINKIEDSKFSKIQSFVRFDPIILYYSFHPLPNGSTCETTYKQIFPRHNQPSLLDDLGLSSLLRTSVSVLTFRWTSDYHERSKKDRLCSGPEPGKPKISQGLPKILTRHDRRAKS